MRRASAVLLGLALIAAPACAEHKTAPPESVRERPRVLTVSATAYCIDGTTRSGAETRPGVIAADPRVLPIGSIVRLDGIGRGREYQVLDTGPAVKGREIDIFMRDCRAAKRFGRKTVRLRVLRLGGAAPQP